MTNEHKPSSEGDKHEKQYIDLGIDIFDNVRPRFSLRLLSALAGSLIAITATSVTIYLNMKNRVENMEVEVKEVKEELKTMYSKYGEAIHNLEKNDERLKSEIERTNERIK